MITALTNSVELDLSESLLSSEGFVQLIQSLKKLVTLNVRGGNLSNLAGQLPSLSLPNLQYLNLESFQDGNRHLKMPVASHLFYKHKTIPAFVTTPCPRMERAVHRWVYNRDLRTSVSFTEGVGFKWMCFGNEGSAQFDGSGRAVCPNLEELDVSDNTQLGAEGVNLLVSDSPWKLKCVKLENCQLDKDEIEGVEKKLLVDGD